MIVAHQLARLGHGIELLPDFMIEVDFHQGVLVKMLLEYPVEQADAWIVNSPQCYKLLAVQVMLKYLFGAGGRSWSLIPFHRNQTRLWNTSII